MSSERMDLDWPMSGAASDGDEYAKYADVYDVLFGAIADDADYYIRCAGTRIRPGGAILEVGTGTGRVAEHLLRAGFRVTGVDSSAEMLAHAARKLASHGEAFDWARADIRTMALGRTFPVAVAPYGMMAHMLTDDDRRASFRRVYEHLEPGGIFVFDDMPGWLSGHADGKGLAVRHTGYDPVAKMPVRMMSNCMEVVGQPLSVRYDFVDWLVGDKVAKRLVIRVIFRDISLESELALLKEAGFHEIDLFGDFDGRPFDRQNLEANTRLILRCRR